MTKQQLLRRSKWFCVCTCCLVIAGQSGCDHETRTPTVPVTGRLLRDGKPVAHATVVLHPKEELAIETPRPRATTDSQGNFLVTTYDTGDGAPEGDYAITVEQWIRDDPNKSPSNKLPSRYSNTQSSGMSLRVVAGTHQTATLELKR